MSTVSVDTLGKLLDLTPRRIQQLVKEGVLPRPIERGQYEVVACVRTYVRHLSTLRYAESDDLQAQRTRLVKAQADRAERENAIAAGNLIDVAIAAQVISDALSDAPDDWRDRAVSALKGMQCHPV
ncbi:hypothetical protein [Chitinimonas sp.]|uniref:hypothetical protein n=1 Tax=Chitinimonas sp. TaxID=1934313 RepID=UPI0035B34C28